ncbi:MAG: tetratricopeptide repeat protein [Stenotrophobium sp.]
MKRALIILAGLLFAGNAAASDIWSGLWLTPDQRGERLLQHGDAVAAAHTYTDPRRKAYAELRAGDYAAAARDFGGFDDSDAHYNRGNALARAGDLQQALKAYDAALARDSTNHDAQHNRDLVEQALKKQEQQQQQKNSSGNGKPQSGKGGGQGAVSAGPQDQSKQTQSQQQVNANNGSGKQDAATQNSQGRPNGATPPGQTGKQSQPATSQATQAGQGKSQLQPAKPTDDAAQAKNDVTGSLPQSAQGKNVDKGETASQPSPSVSGEQQPTAPNTEQQLAEQQWLRRIPDDPGGLLRRKFMIEHMMRQQNQNQQSQQDQ